MKRAMVDEGKNPGDDRTGYTHPHARYGGTSRWSGQRDHVAKCAVYGVLFRSDRICIIGRPSWPAQALLAAHPWHLTEPHPTSPHSANALLIQRQSPRFFPSNPEYAIILRIQHSVDVIVFATKLTGQKFKFPHHKFIPFLDTGASAEESCAHAWRTICHLYTNHLEFCISSILSIRTQNNKTILIKLIIHI